jgi:RecB family endonuclease NucS
MTTMAEAVRTYVQSASRKVTADEIRQYINKEFPDRWKASTLQAHLYACVVNNPKAYIHHPFAERFLFRHADGTFEIYSEETHGPNQWVPTESEDDATLLDKLAETSISLERDIEEHLVHHLDAIESGLKLVGRQVSTDIGRVDILAEDAKGVRVVIEVKIGDAKDSAIGQIARYLGWYAKTEARPPRGILIAADFPEGVRYAATAIPGVTLIAYRVQFSFERIVA